MGFMKDFPEKVAELIRGKKEEAAPNYTYDPNSQQYTKMKKGGKVSSASSRADGCAVKGKTKGRMI
jgi:hypothetical protein